MRVLVVGGGGREHALIWSLAQSPGVDKLYCTPGNGGIMGLAECVPIGTDELGKLEEFARQQRPDLTVVGPEAPLTEGIGDIFREAGLLVFGPGSSGARLEGSKVWAKQFMEKYHIPTGGFASFSDPGDAFAYLERISYPAVVKADGLAAGKGVVVARDHAAAKGAVQEIMVEKAFGRAGDKIVVEECLEGEEISLFAVTDGANYVMLPSAQDHKAAYDGDLGPNTGGMGAYSPAGILTPSLEEEAKQKIFAPVLEGLRQEGIDYRGLLYAGCMLTTEGLQVLEFNVRFGDPETQVVLPRLKSPLLPLLYGAARGNLDGVEPPTWSPEAAVCVVMASGGYPGSYEGGKEISGLADAGEEKTVIFHAGTARVDDSIVSSGGRVLGVTAWDADMKTARDRAYRMVETISFEGAYYRRDIGHRALER